MSCNGSFQLWRKTFGIKMTLLKFNIGNDQYQSLCDFIEQILKHKFVRQSWKGTLNSIHCVVLSEPV
jgi:hypothetical protein